MRSGATYDVSICLEKTLPAPLIPISPEADGERVVVTSIAAELRLRTSEGVRVPEEAEVSQNVLLLVINPQTRTLTTLLHQHGVGDMD